MAAVSQRTLSNAFSWMKMLEFRLRFHWSLFLMGPINNIPALVQIMAWHRSGDKPLSEPMMVSLLMHICVTQPQWVKGELLAVHNEYLGDSWSQARHELWGVCCECFGKELVLGKLWGVFVLWMFWRQLITGELWDVCFDYFGDSWSQVSYGMSVVITLETVDHKCAMGFCCDYFGDSWSQVSYGLSFFSILEIINGAVMLLYSHYTYNSAPWSSDGLCW